MLTMMTRSAAVCRDLTCARRIYADDGTVVVVDTGSVGRTLAGCL